MLVCRGVTPWVDANGLSRIWVLHVALHVGVVEVAQTPRERLHRARGCFPAAKPTCRERGSFDLLICSLPMSKQGVARLLLL